MKTSGLRNVFLLSSALIFLGLFSYCTGLKCYVCNSAFQKDCDDKMIPEKYLVTCSPSTASPNTPSTDNQGGSFLAGDENRLVRYSAPKGVNYTVCRKVSTTIPQQDNKDTSKAATARVFRSCGYIDPGESACKWIASQGTQTQSCQCNEDSCNSASVKTGSILVFATLFLFAGLMNSF